MSDRESSALPRINPAPSLPPKAGGPIRAFLHIQVLRISLEPADTLGKGSSSRFIESLIGRATEKEVPSEIHSFKISDNLFVHVRLPGVNDAGLYLYSKNRLKDLRSSVLEWAGDCESHFHAGSAIPLTYRRSIHRSNTVHFPIRGSYSRLAHYLEDAKVITLALQYPTRRWRNQMRGTLASPTTDRIVCHIPTNELLTDMSPNTFESKGVCVSKYPVVYEGSGQCIGAAYVHVTVEEDPCNFNSDYGDPEIMIAQQRNRGDIRAIVDEFEHNRVFDLDDEDTDGLQRAVGQASDVHRGTNIAVHANQKHSPKSDKGSRAVDRDTPDVDELFLQAQRLHSLLVGALEGDEDAKPAIPSTTSQVASFPRLDKTDTDKLSQTESSASSLRNTGMRNSWTENASQLQQSTSFDPENLESDCDELDNGSLEMLMGNLSEGEEELADLLELNDSLAREAVRTPSFTQRIFKIPEENESNGGERIQNRRDMSQKGVFHGTNYSNGREEKSSSIGQEQTQLYTARFTNGIQLHADVVAAVGRVHSVKIDISHAELHVGSLPLGFTKFKLHASLVTENGAAIHAPISPFNFELSGEKESVPRNAQRGVRYDIQERSDQRITIRFSDRSRIYPWRFDMSPVSCIDAWAKSRIVVKLVAKAGRLPVGRNTTEMGKKPLKQQDAWTAIGQMKCLDILLKPQLAWSGRVPLFDETGRSKSVYEHSRNSVDTVSIGTKRLAVRHVGEAFVSVELLDSPTQITHETPTIKSKDPGNSEQPSDQIRDNVVGKSHPHSVTKYFLIQISSARALHLVSAPGKRYAISLTIRLLNVSTEKARRDNERNRTHKRSKEILRTAAPLTIESAPVAYHSAVNTETGHVDINQSAANFGFQYIMPVPVLFKSTNAATQLFKSPLVVEVWASEFEAGTSSSPGRNETSQELDSSEDQHVKSRPVLLGLAKLPSYHLYDLMTIEMEIATQNTHQKVADPEPVVLPEAEYPIVDPLSGIAKGWMNATMAIGTLEQVNHIVKEGKGPYAEPGKGRGCVLDGGTQTESAPDAIQKSEELQDPPMETESDSEYDFDDLDIDTVSLDWSGECEFQITIHRGAGFRPLVKAAIEKISSLTSIRPAQQYPDPVGLSGEDEINSVLDAIKTRWKRADFVHDDSFTQNHYMSERRGDPCSLIAPLEYAKEVGLNPYVRFQLFPREVAVVVSDGLNDNDVDGSEFGTATVAQTFCPKFNHSVVISLKGVNSEILDWMQSRKGFAVGEVWHRVSNSLEDSRVYGNISSSSPSCLSWRCSHADIGFDTRSRGSDGGYDVLIGKFNLSLSDVTRRWRGLNRIWRPLSLPDDASSDFNFGAIETSIRFVSQSADEKRDARNASRRLKALKAKLPEDSWYAQLGISIETIIIPKAKNAVADALRSLAGTAKETGDDPVAHSATIKAMLEAAEREEQKYCEDVFVRFSLPVQYHQDMKAFRLLGTRNSEINCQREFLVSHAAPLELTHTLKLCKAELNYDCRKRVHMLPIVESSFKNEQFRVDIWRRRRLASVAPLQRSRSPVRFGVDTNESDNEESIELAGSCFLDLWDLMKGAKHRLRKGDLMEDHEATEGWFPMICDDRADLEGAKIYARVSILPMHELKAKPKVSLKVQQPYLTADISGTSNACFRVEPSGRGEAYDEEPSASKPESPASPGTLRMASRYALDSEIASPSKFLVVIQQATQLPLVSDPAQPFASPFMASDDQPQLAFPNPYLTVESDCDEAFHRSHTVKSSTDPVWNFSCQVIASHPSAIRIRIWTEWTPKQSDFIGTATLTDLENDYITILDHNGSQRGRLVVRVIPWDNCGAPISSISRIDEKKPSGEASLRNFSMAKSATFLSIEVPPEPIRRPPSAPPALAAAIAASKKARASNDVDIWVWTGTAWEPRSKAAPVTTTTLVSSSPDGRERSKCGESTENGRGDANDHAPQDDEASPSPPEDTNESISRIAQQVPNGDQQVPNGEAHADKTDQTSGNTSSYPPPIPQQTTPLKNSEDVQHCETSPKLNLKASWSPLQISSPPLHISLLQIGDTQNFSVSSRSYAPIARGEGLIEEMLSGRDTTNNDPLLVRGNTNSGSASPIYPSIDSSDQPAISVGRIDATDIGKSEHVDWNENEPPCETGELNHNDHHLDPESWAGGSTTSHFPACTSEVAPVTSVTQAAGNLHSAKTPRDHTRSPIQLPEINHSQPSNVHPFNTGLSPNHNRVAADNDEASNISCLLCDAHKGNNSPETLLPARSAKSNLLHNTGPGDNIVPVESAEGSRDQQVPQFLRFESVLKHSGDQAVDIGSVDHTNQLGEVEVHDENESDDSDDFQFSRPAGSRHVPRASSLHNTLSLQLAKSRTTQEHRLSLQTSRSDKEVRTKPWAERGGDQVDENRIIWLEHGEEDEDENDDEGSTPSLCSIDGRSGGVRSLSEVEDLRSLQAILTHKRGKLEVNNFARWRNRATLKNIENQKFVRDGSM
ncbi:hypothetical protein BJ742DRAFT_797852 [Cladochytrium replicatum]|nr:hypothetical protein BJ742DRAFT_797852 [Cladochytrium replicatum]